MFKQKAFGFIEFDCADMKYGLTCPGPCPSEMKQAQMA